MTLKSALDWSVDVAAIDRGRILRAGRVAIWPGSLMSMRERSATYWRVGGGPTFATLRAICRALELPLHAVITFSDGDAAVLSAGHVETEVRRLG